MIAFSRRRALAWISALPFAGAALPTGAATPGKKFNIYEAPKPMADVHFVYGGGKSMVGGSPERSATFRANMCF